MFSEAAKNLGTDTNKKVCDVAGADKDKVFVALAEVFIGNQFHTFLTPSSVPNGYDSVRLAGNSPDAQGNFLHNDGYIIPLGKVVNTNQNGTLHFVNKLSHIRVRYLLHVEILNVDANPNQLNYLLPNNWAQFQVQKRYTWRYYTAFGWHSFGRGLQSVY